MTENARSEQAETVPGSIWRTLALCLVLVAAGTAGVILIFATEPTAQRESAVRRSASLVDVVRGEAGSFRPTITVTGTVRPAREIFLSARVQGEVVELGTHFVPGGFVAAGDLLVRIEDDDYQVEREQMDSALEQAIAELEIERGAQAAAVSDYQQFDRELASERRALVLREPQMRAAQANVDAARANLRRAELNLERTTVEAPFDAHVLDRGVNLGSQVGSGTQLGRLVGLESYWIEATVPVSRLEWVMVPRNGSEGSQVVIGNDSAWGGDAKRTGRVFRLIGELEGNTRLARILVTVDDPLALNDPSLPRLMLGEFVDARIEGREISAAIRLPREYVREGDTVWLMADNRLVIRPVEIAFQDDRYAYITAGLTAVDQVVTTRLATVEEGLRLRLETDDSASPASAASQ